MTTGVVTEEKATFLPFGGEAPANGEGPIAAQIAGPGFVMVYETRTGEPREINRNNLLGALAKNHKDPAYPEWKGKPLFSLIQPRPFVLGTYKCLLHPDQPERAEYDRRGLPSCPASHLPSADAVMQHMLHKHPEQWASIERERAEKERLAQQAIQQQQVGVLTNLVETLVAERMQKPQAQQRANEDAPTSPSLGRPRRQVKHRRAG